MVSFGSCCYFIALVINLVIIPPVWSQNMTETKIRKQHEAAAVYLKLIPSVLHGRQPAATSTHWRLKVTVPTRLLFSQEVIQKFINLLKLQCKNFLTLRVYLRLCRTVFHPPGYKCLVPLMT